jgi:hypothetical protein
MNLNKINKQSTKRVINGAKISTMMVDSEPGMEVNR